MLETGSLSVSQLNLMVAEAIRKDPRIRSVTVRGEVSGFRHHLSSGHWYFSLKDDESSVSCVMFRQNTFRAQMRPRDGDAVQVTGYVDVYPKNGSYQLYVTGLRAGGTGDLFIRYEELKNRLNAEGLFAPERKRMLPMVPRKVAVVTSASGAALHDILNVSGMRNPSIPIVLIPVSVQGERAAGEIAAGIRKANEQTDAEVLIVARGGGSAEDLWCFNEETVARAVAGSRIPVVSGVGHEIDTTICDLAADVRASTPSNAAEIVFPDRKELKGRTRALALLLYKAAGAQIQAGVTKTRETALRLSALRPGRQIAELNARCRLSRGNLIHALDNRLENQAGNLRMERIRMENAMTRRMDAAATQAGRIRERLKAMNPLGMLERGYVLVQNREGRVLTERKQALEAKDMTVRFADGSVNVTVTTDGE